jgi:uncharacterized protein with GYD domain
MKNPAFLLNLSSGSVRTVEDEPERTSAINASAAGGVGDTRYSRAIVGQGVADDGRTPDR